MPRAYQYPDKITPKEARDVIKAITGRGPNQHAATVGQLLAHIQAHRPLRLDFEVNRCRGLAYTADVFHVGTHAPFSYVRITP